MFIVLKAEYNVIVEEEEVLISHLFSDYHRSIKISLNINKEQLVEKLLFGLTINRDKSLLSQEDKFMIIIGKQLKEIFLITEDEDKYRKQVNIRGVLLTANKSWVEPSIIKDYLENFDEEVIYILGSDQELQSYFQREGLFQTKAISIKDLPSLNNRNIILLNERDLSQVQSEKNTKYLVYSLDRLRVGPLLIPGTTICIECYNKNYVLNGIVKEGYPVYYKNFILNFLVNTVYFCLNDLHKSLGADVGLPIRKYYELEQPNLSLSVTDIYKTNFCSLCFVENKM